MKTTLDLPDELFVAAKKRAADERRPLRDLVAASLRAQLQPPRSGRKAKAIEWVTVKGGLPAGMGVADRDVMHDSLRRAGDRARHGFVTIPGLRPVSPLPS